MREKEIRRIFDEFARVLRYLGRPTPPIQEIRKREEVLTLLNTYREIQARVQAEQLRHQLMANIDQLVQQVEKLKQTLELPLLIQVEKPKEGDSFSAGETIKVEWKCLGAIGNILEAALYQGEHLIKYLGRYPNTGSFYWSIPKFYPTLSDLTIKLVDPASLATGKSGSFSIRGEG